MSLSNKHLLGFLVIFFCAACAPTDSDEVEDGKADGAGIKVMATFHRDSAGAATATWSTGPIATSGVLEGKAIAELVDGKSYQLTLRPTTRLQGTVKIFQLVSYQIPLRLIGKLAKNGSDYVLTTALAHSYIVKNGSALFKKTLERKDEDGSPYYDLANMLLDLRALQKPGDTNKTVEVLAFEQVPLFACQYEKGNVFLKLSTVRSADTVLDAYEWAKQGSEDRPIALGTCRLTDGAYACTLTQDQDIYGRILFERPIPPDYLLGDSFPITIARTDAAATQLGFICSETDSANAAQQSDD